jgi:hypothetical protein
MQIVFTGIACLPNQSNTDQMSTGTHIYAVGGFNGSMRVRTVDVYDTVRDQWMNGPSMDARRSTLGVATLGGRIYAVGGFDGSVGLYTAEAFDPRTGEWQMVSNFVVQFGTKTHAHIDSQHDYSTQFCRCSRAQWLYIGRRRL